MLPKWHKISCISLSSTLKNFISYEEEIEEFLYISREELFGFINDIIEFWNEIPIFKYIDSQHIYEQIKIKKKEEEKKKKEQINKERL